MTMSGIGILVSFSAGSSPANIQFGVRNVVGVNVGGSVGVGITVVGGIVGVGSSRRHRGRGSKPCGCRRRSACGTKGRARIPTMAENILKPERETVLVGIVATGAVGVWTDVGSTTRTKKGDQVTAVSNHSLAQAVMSERGGGGGRGGGT
jgi:hypothetical protein